MAVSEQDLELAGAAKESFYNNRYESCLSALNKLLDSRRYDGRVLHNRAVAQYLLSNLTHTDNFRKTLHSVNTHVICVWLCVCTFLQKTLCVQFDRAAESNGEVEMAVGDKGVLLYNQALIHLRVGGLVLFSYYEIMPTLSSLQLHQNAHAAQILEQLFKAKDALSM